jgi:hypothetical protein
MQSVRALVASLLLAGVAAAAGLPAHAAAAGKNGPGPAATAADVMPEPAYAPISAVAIMLDTGQALVFDETSGKYRLVMVGDVVAGWKVVTIEATRVVVVHGEERDVLGLVVPPRAIEGIALPAPARLAPVQVVPAPRDAEAAEARPAPAPITKVRPAPPAEDPTAPRKLSRGELDRELRDFDRLGAAVDVTLAVSGGFRLTRVDKGSWPYRMGLREGDVIRAVAGERVATVEDAARVYARLRTTRAFTVEVDRPMAGIVDDGDPPATRVVLQYTVK